MNNARPGARRTKVQDSPVRAVGKQESNGDSLMDVAYEVIRRRIISLEIPPGAFFTESKLAQELKFSKTPVREALGVLRREALVEVQPRAGYRATPVTLGGARDLFAVRTILESEAAAMAAMQHNDLSHLLELEEICREGFPVDDREAALQFVAANTKLHVGIARASGNPILAEMVGQLLNHMERLFMLGLSLSRSSERVTNDHKSLLTAVMSGEPETAKRVAAEHVKEAKTMVIDALLSSPSVLTANLGGKEPQRVGDMPVVRYQKAPG